MHSSSSHTTTVLVEHALTGTRRHSGGTTQTLWIKSRTAGTGILGWIMQPRTSCYILVRPGIQSNHQHTHTHAHDRPRLMQHQRVEFHVSYFETDSHVTQQAVDSEERSRINTAFGDGTVSAWCPVSAFYPTVITPACNSVQGPFYFNFFIADKKNSSRCTLRVLYYVCSALWAAGSSLYKFPLLLWYLILLWLLLWLWWWWFQQFYREN